MDICRAKKLSRMTEKLSENLLAGVVTVSDGVTAPVVGSKAGQKFFRMLPGDVLLASLDAFKKVLDAAEVVGRDALSAASEATVEIVANMYCILDSSCLGRKQELPRTILFHRFRAPFEKREETK